jgi:hypothetical protein
MRGAKLFRNRKFCDPHHSPDSDGFLQFNLRKSPGLEALMPTNYVNWSSRIAIAARVAECERRSRGWDEWIPGDYHGPFGHGQARAEAARLLWQF